MALKAVIVPQSRCRISDSDRLINFNYNFPVMISIFQNLSKRIIEEHFYIFPQYFLHFYDLNTHLY